MHSKYLVVAVAVMAAVLPSVPTIADNPLLLTLSLVKDINPSPTDGGNSNPDHLTVVGHAVYILACDDLRGCGLRRSNSGTCVELTGLANTNSQAATAGVGGHDCRPLFVELNGP